jgi:hypothetical protein
MRTTRGRFFSSLVSGALSFVLGPRSARSHAVDRDRRVAQGRLRGSAAFTGTPCQQESLDRDKTMGSAAEDDQRRAT